ncbi:hypothetical protein RHSIM_Rhsim05G0106000 [Rhododendron simsii]|uniref:Uncharacterized protein n=1 Tax=Rhododendron simsii TaxID=118357 RepID=A0A834GZY3_RHOSS|nr:hypothetical protein RHSIM_Rhsim05G0106000 [Rhododendron simsii]
MFLRGDRPVSIEDSASSLEMTIALAQGLLLPPDMAKEKESTLDRIERTAISHSIRSIQKVVEACARAKHGDAEAAHLTAKNASLLAENNRLSEENFKLRDTTTQMGQQLEIEQGKRKDVKADFAKAMEELGKAEGNVRIFEKNMSKADNNGFDEAFRQFELQVLGVVRKIWACWAHCLGRVGMAEHSPLSAQNQISEGMDLTITKIGISDDEARPSAFAALPLTSAVSGHQEAGCSSTAAAMANLSAPPELAT